MLGHEPNSWEPRGEAPKSEWNLTATKSQNLYENNGSGLKVKIWKIKNKNKGDKKKE